MIIDVASYLHFIYVVCHVVFTLCPYCNDIALVFTLCPYCIGYAFLVVNDTMLLQYGYKLYYCINFILYSCCLYFVFMLYSYFFNIVFALHVHC
jgi:hypothetical protein